MNTTPGSTQPLLLRPMLQADWPAVSRIYAEGIATGQATFESRVPRWDAFDASHPEELRIVAEGGPGIQGWAAASPVSGREVYAGVVEHSVYIAAAARGHGIGRLLLRGLVAAAETAGIWTIQSSIFPENTVSLALHRAEGFRVVGRRERIAKMTHGPQAGQWRDTLFLERRSTVAGSE